MEIFKKNIAQHNSELNTVDSQLLYSLTLGYCKARLHLFI